MPAVVPSAVPVPTPRISSLLDAVRQELGHGVERLETSVAALSTEVQVDRCLTRDLLQRVADLESRLAALDGCLPTHKEDPWAVQFAKTSDPQTDKPEAMTLPEEASPGDGREVLDYSFGDSLWDAPLVIGLLGSWLPSTLLLVSTLLNVFCQVYIAVVLLQSPGFINKQLWARLLRASERWRSYEAHEYDQMDASQTSLAARVCGRDESLSVAEDQSDILMEVNNYLGLKEFDLEQTGFGTGPLLCSICLFLFAVVIVRDLRSTFLSFLATCSVPRGSETRYLNGEIVTMCRCRLVGIVLINSSRVMVALALLFTGIMWLSYTSSITELILNVTALHFVMDMDELLYQTTVPAVVHKVVSEFKPLKFRRPRCHCEALVPMFMICFIVWVSVMFLVVPATHSMLEVKAALCGGNLDFVVHKNPLGFIIARQTIPWSPAEKDGGIKVKAVTELKTIQDTDKVIYSYFAPNNDVFQSEIEASVEEGAKADSNCIDMDLFQGGLAKQAVPYIFAGMTELTGLNSHLDYNPETWHCSSHKGFCDDYATLRLLCPITCGCADPQSGLMMVSTANGCPAGCSPVRQAAWANLTCADTAVANTPAWARYWHGFADAFSRVFSQEGSDPQFLAYIEAQIGRNCSEMVQQDPFIHVDICKPDGTIMENLNMQGPIAFCPETCCRRGNATRSMACPADC